MKKIISLLFLISFIAILPLISSAWGKKGHSLTAEIAFYFCDSTTKETVQKYLGEMTIEQAGSWMDEMRSDRKFDYMKPWHYVNVEKGTSYEANKDENIINELTKAIDALQNKEKNKLSKEDIKRNILIIFHLCGDLHQPLHVGYGDDKGGNSIEVKYLTKESNLHRVWDSEIIEGEKITINDCLKHYTSFDKKMIEQLKVINVENWMRQPRALLGNVYNFKDNTIDQKYIDKNKKIIEEQLLIGGIRLAAILQMAFKA